MPHFSNMTDNYRIPKEAHQTGIADAYTFNAAMDWIDAILADSSIVGDPHWKSPVANSAALPLIGNNPGDARIALDTGVLWVWNGSSWEEGTSGAIIYRGVWDANANLPPLASGVGNKGDYYVIGVSGNTNLDGITDWVVGDWAIFNGTAWEKADHTDAVASVFGRKGAVTAQAGDYSHGQLSGIGADDHHAKSHAHDGLDGSGQVAHANTTGQTADDHHAKSHAHDGVDGSGTVAHSSLTGIGSDDHHARQHALSSALDHTGSITDTQHGSRSGGTLHPVVTPDPAGVAGFMSGADKAKLNGISAGAALLQDYQFGESVKVPGGGTLQLKGPGNTTVALRMNRAGTITGASLQVDVVDAAQAFDLHVYKNGVSVATVNLPINTLGASSAALAVAVAVGDLITLWVIRVGAGGASTFTSEHAMVEVKF